MERLVALRAQLDELLADSDDSDLFDGEKETSEKPSELASGSNESFSAEPTADDLEKDEENFGDFDVSPKKCATPEESESSDEDDGDDGTFLSYQRKKWQSASGGIFQSNRTAASSSTVTVPTTMNISRTSATTREFSLPNYAVPTAVGYGNLSAQVALAPMPMSSAPMKLSSDHSHASCAYDVAEGYEPQPSTSRQVSGVTLGAIWVSGRRYQQLNELGRGGSSKVYQVFDAENNVCRAVKIVDLEGQDEYVVKAYLNEIQLLKKLQHVPYVIRMFAYEYVEEDKKIYVVMEKGDTDLAKVFKTFVNDADKLVRIKSYWLDMLRAVRMVHLEGIVHSDLKPSNFVLVEGVVKLIDFGIANAVPSNKTSVTKDCQMGTLNYMSPEAVQNASGTELVKIWVNQKSDVWSLGVILYSLVYGKTPFQHLTTIWAKVMAIVNPQHLIEFRDVGDDNLVAVMKMCLERDQKKRPTIDQLLQHPYVKNSANPQLSDDHLRSMLTAINTQSPGTALRTLKEALGRPE